MSVREWSRNQRGEWFVVAQAVLMIGALLAPLLDAQPITSLTSALGGLLGAAGLTFVVLGSLRLGRNLSPFPKPLKGGTLVRNGVFALVRHPIYTGFILLMFGWSLMWRSLAALVGALLLLAFFDIKARREERWLAAAFTDYSEYRQRVRKLIPFVY
jgi:protein-S-isoprenylcysteine O-methyltransferase Ste14